MTQSISSGYRNVQYKEKDVSFGIKQILLQLRLLKLLNSPSYNLFNLKGRTNTTFVGFYEGVKG